MIVRTEKSGTLEAYCAVAQSGAFSADGDDADVSDPFHSSCIR